VWFWILLFLGSILGFIQGVQAAAANAQVCTYWKATGKLFNCDSATWAIVSSLGLGAFAAWRIYANWKKGAPPPPGPTIPGIGQAAQNRIPGVGDLPMEPPRQVHPPDSVRYSSDETGGLERQSSHPREPPVLTWPTTTASDRYFPYEGENHSLGITRSADMKRYVIEGPGGRVVRDFVYASDGWSAAWKTFSELEPRWETRELTSRNSGTTPAGETADTTLEASDETTMTDPRRITYEIGKEVVTPSGSRVQVLVVEDAIDWTTPDGGAVEPAPGNRFSRIRVTFENRGPRDDIGLLADAFSIELSDGVEVLSLEEAYGPDELQGRYKEYVEEGQRIAGWIYYERPDTPATVKYALFDAGEDEETTGPIIRWY
jgi:hypothetical protein